MDSLWYDVRHATRTLVRAPAYALAAILVLAAGIGATAVVFAVVDGVLLRPLPYPEPDRLTMIWDVASEEPGRLTTISPGNVVDWRAETRSFEGIAIFHGDSTFVRDGGVRQRISGASVSANYFDIVGIQAELGRTFLPGDDAPGAAPLMVISDGFWRRRFGADPSVLGRELSTESGAFRVVGVMPPGFRAPARHFFDPPDYWITMRHQPGSVWVHRSSRWARTLARLKPGVAIDAARRDVGAVAAALATRYPETNARWSATVVRLEDVIARDVRRPLWLLLAAVAVLALITGANVTALFVARTAARAPQLAMQVALGAPPARLARALLIEGAAIALVGGAAGCALAAWGTPALVALTDALPRADGIEVGYRAVALALALPLILVTVLALAPVLRATRTGPATGLRPLGQGATAAAGAQRFRRVLIVAQMSGSVLLLVGAGLLLRTYLAITRVDLGFSAPSVVMARLALPGLTGSDTSPRVRLLEDVLTRVRALPGVTSAGLITALPLDMYGDIQFTARLFDEGAPRGVPARYRAVTPGYFETASLSLLHGRLFDERDRRAGEDVLVVNDTFVRQYLAGRDPIGRRVSFGLGGRFDGRIVGVVAGVRYESPTKAAEPEIYVPLMRAAVFNVVFLAVRGPSPASLLPSIPRAVRGASPLVVVEQVQPLARLLDRAVERPRLNALVIGAFSLLATALALVGLYAVVAYALARRRRELAVRAALGASRRRLVGLVLREGLGLSSIGIGIGLAAAWLVARGLESQLYGVAAGDPITWAGAPGLLLLVSLAACLIPARRAGRVDPARLLRLE